MSISYNPEVASNLLIVPILMESDDAGFHRGHGLLVKKNFDTSTYRRLGYVSLYYIRDFIVPYCMREGVQQEHIGPLASSMFPENLQCVLDRFEKREIVLV